MLYLCRDEAALKVALGTLRLQYDAVVVLEQLPDSLALLEVVLPRYFAGARRAAGISSKLRRAPAGKRNRIGIGGGIRSRQSGAGGVVYERRNEHKAETGEGAMDLLRRLNALDIMFYNEVSPGRAGRQFSDDQGAC